MVKNIKTFLIFIRLLFNRNRPIQSIIKRGKKCVWLTTHDNYGLRINYYNPDQCLWHGSSPAERIGLFGYRTFCFPGGNKDKKIVGTSAERFIQHYG